MKAGAVRSKTRAASRGGAASGGGASLREYVRKRNFQQTAEPRGAAPKAAGSAARFVIQKHDASRLHYDFRLEIDGTLKSWAVPKGVPFAKSEKRLAVQVEDHPIEYGKFEGTIPEGQYGGGTVMLWDRGTFEMLGGSAAQAWKEGKLHFALQGQKLQGEWTLVRTKIGDGQQWLLIKSGESLKPLSRKADDASALSTRSMAEIAAKAPPAPPVHKVQRVQRVQRVHPVHPVHPVHLAFIEPMKATLVDHPPTDGEWDYELKLDGYRTLALKSGSRVELFSRNRKDFAGRFPEIAEAVAAMPGSDLILDGEIVALDAQGRPSFQLLQGVELAPTRPPLAFYVFDLLHSAGEDLTALPLHERRGRLEAALKKVQEPIRFSATLPGDPAALLKEVQRLGMEGLIGKERHSTYEAGRRSPSWIKLKCLQEQEFVIGGYTPPQGSRQRFGALLVGVFEDGKLRFTGKVGTGFEHATLEQLYHKLHALERKNCPFSGLPEKSRRGWNLTAAEMKHCHWTAARLVAQIRFTEWTEDGKLRHPVFLGLREDKEPEEVIRERPSGGKKMGQATRKAASPTPAKAPSRRTPPKAEPMSSKSTLQVAGRSIPVSNLDKVLYPETGFTKGQVIDYYIRVAPVLLPHLAKRPITLKRYPDGVEGFFFYEKRCPAHRPSWVKTVSAPRSDGEDAPIGYCVMDDLPALIWAANLADLELHTFLHRGPALSRPNALAFDLDPGPPADIVLCSQVGLWLKAFFDGLGLQSFAKTSGSKGLQVFVPLNTAVDYDQTKAFAHALAERFERDHPEAVVSRMAKVLRKGKVFIDWSQNDEHKTMVNVYSLRAKPHPTVSTPVTWEEVEAAVKKRDANRLVFETEDVLRRVEKWGDLFAPVLSLKQKLPSLKKSGLEAENGATSPPPPAKESRAPGARKGAASTRRGPRSGK